MDDIVPFLEQNAVFLQTMGAGLAGILIPLLGGAPAVLRHLGAQVAFGGWRPYSPNWITVYSLVGTAAGAGLFFAGYPAIGIFLACFAGILDRLDGRMAHVWDAQLDPPGSWTQDPSDGVWHARVKHPARDSTSLERCRPGRRWWMEMNFRGGTDLGKVLDPAFDKVKSIGLLAAFASLGLVSPWLLALMAVPELLGTLMRRPFHLLKGHQVESKASAIGKWKAMLQWVILILCAPFHQGWLDGWTAHERGQLLNGMMVSCVALCWMSVLSRLAAVRRTAVGRSLHELDRSFSHD